LVKCDVEAVIILKVRETNAHLRREINATALLTAMVE